MAFVGASWVTLQMSVVTQQGLMSTVSEKQTASVAAQSSATVVASNTVLPPETVGGGVVVAVEAVVVPLVQVPATHTEPSSQIPT